VGRSRTLPRSTASGVPSYASTGERANATRPGANGDRLDIRGPVVERADAAGRTMGVGSFRAAAALGVASAVLGVVFLSLETAQFPRHRRRMLTKEFQPSDWMCLAGSVILGWPSYSTCRCSFEYSTIARRFPRAHPRSRRSGPDSKGICREEPGNPRQRASHSRASGEGRALRGFCPWMLSTAARRWTRAS